MRRSATITDAVPEAAPSLRADRRAASTRIAATAATRAATVRVPVRVESFPRSGDLLVSSIGVSSLSGEHGDARVHRREVALSATARTGVELDVVDEVADDAAAVVAGAARRDVV